jgi:hypothetical protein
MCLNFRVRPLGETDCVGTFWFARVRRPGWVCTRTNVTLCEAQPCSRGFQGGDLCLHEKPCCGLRVATGRAWLPRWYPHPRVYMRVQGTMTNVTVGPVYNPYRASLPLAHQIGLGPHVAGYCPLLGGVGSPGGAPFEDTPVRTLTQLHAA